VVSESVNKKQIKNREIEADVERFRQTPGKYLGGKFGLPGKIFGNAIGYTFGIAAGFVRKFLTRIKGIIKIAASPVAGLTVGTAMGVIDVVYGLAAVGAGIVTVVVAGAFSERARKKFGNLMTGGAKKIGLGLTAPFTVAGAMLSSGAYNLALGKQSPWSVMDKYNNVNNNASDKIWENTAPPPKINPKYEYMDDDKSLEKITPFRKVPRDSLNEKKGREFNLVPNVTVNTRGGRGRG
jgi:hypothetical protein